VPSSALTGISTLRGAATSIAKVWRDHPTRSRRNSTKTPTDRAFREFSRYGAGCYPAGVGDRRGGRVIGVAKMSDPPTSRGGRVSILTAASCRYEAYRRVIQLGPLAKWGPAMRTRSPLVPTAVGMLMLVFALAASALPGDTPASLTCDRRNPVDHRASYLCRSRSPGHRGWRNHQRPSGPGLCQRHPHRPCRIWLCRHGHLTAFAQPSRPARPTSAVGYNAGILTKVGTATYTANDPSNLSVAVLAVTATGIAGDNCTAWNPMINVAVPCGMAIGVYSATITHSVA
jgi:hypothetical protein